MNTKISRALKHYLLWNVIDSEAGQSLFGEVFTMDAGIQWNKVRLWGTVEL